MPSVATLSMYSGGSAVRAKSRMSCWEAASVGRATSARFSGSFDSCSVRKSLRAVGSTSSWMASKAPRAASWLV